VYHKKRASQEISLGRLSPFAHLVKTDTELNDKNRFVPPVFLDYVAVQQDTIW